MQIQKLTPAEMDHLLDAHFRAEAEVNIPAINATFTADVEHDLVGSPPGGPLHGKGAVGAFYARLLENLAIEQFTSVRRLYGDDFVVDESIVDGHAQGIVGGREGRGRPVRFRLLHVFEFRDGLIARENAWLDLAAVQQQLP
jgi:ketosteroid isomerase-like protein